MPYCYRCDRHFRTNAAFWQHKNNSTAHNMCEDCELDFPTWAELAEHWVQDDDHIYCQDCNEHFEHPQHLEDHYILDHFYCCNCQKFFKNAYGLKEHYRQSPVHHYCVSCNRVFQSANNLQAHLNSSVHRPKNVPCPFRGCDQAFVSPSALILHLESGKCQSGVDRAMVNREIIRLDKNRVITDPSRLLTGGITSEVRHYATGAAWNGNKYECYLCHNTYHTLSALNQHLASPRHQDKIYICPPSTCRMRFTTLSALCQHIESEKCGVSRFRVVQNAMDSLVGQMKRLHY